MDERTADWSARAEAAQVSLGHFFGAPWPQCLHNTYPPTSDETFNYWWLAHVIDVRVDAYHRSGDPAWLAAAQDTDANIRCRNGGLFNDYFDDMGWYGLALVRLAAASGEERYLADARRLYRHCLAYGWNDTHGWSLAWRRTQLDYKNTPANGTLAILGAQLAELDPSGDDLSYAEAAFAWLTDTLVGADGFVEDGINRLGDGQIDHQWRFTYNQGLYVGAAIALHRVTGRPGLLETARRTATTAIRCLATDGVFGTEGDGGDEGLFKGVFYRYLMTLIEALPADDPDRAVYAGFIRTGTDRLWETGRHDNRFLAGNDWREPVRLPVAYSTALSALIALEARARLT